MRIAFSNLAWPQETDDDALSLLADCGISGLELAPVKVFGDLEAADERAVTEYRKRAQENGLTIAAFQAYLFGRPELRLFDDSTRQDFVDLTKRTIDIAGWCGANRIVYGAPKSRDRLGREGRECLAIAADTFADIGRYAAERDVIFCLEPNPPAYGCNFACDASTAANLVRLVDSPGFRLHLDTACMTLAGDDIASAIGDNSDILAHFHASEPQLGDFSTPETDHETAAQALRDNDYTGWVSIEMKASSDPLRAVSRAAEYVLETYGD